MVTPFLFSTNMAGGLNLLAIHIYGHPDCIGSYDGVLLKFQDVSVSVVIDYDDCSLSWIEGNILPRDNEQVEVRISDLDKYCGAVCFVWEMVNQAGVQDGLQICILNKSIDVYNTLQFLGGGVGIVINYVIDAYGI